MTTVEAVDTILKQRELTKIIVESIDKNLPNLNADTKNRLISKLAVRLQGANPEGVLNPESIKAYALPLLEEAEEASKPRHTTDRWP